MERLRLAQIGSGHGHAAGKWQALRESPDVDAIGLWDVDQATEALADTSVVGVAVECRNHQSLAVAGAAVEAGKHVWLDKPAGDDLPAFARLLDAAGARGLLVQLGYMFRYSPGFEMLAELVQGGTLGDVFGIRAHMSTHIDLAERTAQSRHRGGILYDLGGHMLDQIVWLLGPPRRVSSVLRNDATPELPTYMDNTLAVLEFPGALVTLEIAAMETPPTARRFEVFGTLGTAILEPFDAPRLVRLKLAQPSGAYHAGENTIELPVLSRQDLYVRELAAFVGAIRGERPRDRTAEHELLVQETLLRATADQVTARNRSAVDS